MLPSIVNQFTYKLVQTNEECIEAFRNVKNSTEFGFDTESNTKDWWKFKKDDIAGISLYTPVNNTAYYIPINQGSYSPEERNINSELVKACLQSVLNCPSKPKFIVGNGKFDSHVINRCLGLDLSLYNYADVLLRSHLSHINFRHSVKALGAEIYEDGDVYEKGLIQVKKMLGITASDCRYYDYRFYPVSIIGIYAAADAFLAWAIYNHQEHFSNLDAFGDYVRIEHDMARVLFSTEEAGIKIDVPYLEEQLEIFNKKIPYEDNLIQVLGERVFNVNSPKQLQSVLYESLGLPKQYKRTKRSDGSMEITISTDKTALNGLLGKHPIVEHILTLRGMQKIKTTYIEGILENLVNNRIYTTFNQFVENSSSLRTGRLSSSDPINFENIPRNDTTIRRAFLPDSEDWYFDYSGQEIRVYTHYSKEPKLLQAFALGEDVHGLGLDEKILTKDGWKLNRELNLADKIAGVDGNFYNITGIFPKGLQDTYKITFSDGVSVICDDAHLWEIQSSDDIKRNKRPYTLSTKQLLERRLRNSRGNKWFVPLTSPINFEEKNLPIDPWLLGFLLGDGGFTQTSLTFTTDDDEIVEKIRQRIPKDHSVIPTAHQHYKISNTKTYRNTVTQVIKKLNLWNHYSYNKFIPEIYKLSAVKQRLELLQGLCDADGSVASSKQGCTFSSTSYALIKDLLELVRSLGGISNGIKESDESSSGYNTYPGMQPVKQYNVYFTLPFNPFTLSCKANKILLTRQSQFRRSIESIQYLGKAETQCINILSPRHLFLTNDFIVTHNSRTCEAVFGIPYAEVNAKRKTDKDIEIKREIAKRIFFGILYGSGAPRVAAILAEFGYGNNEKEARRLLNNLYTSYPRFRIYADQIKAVLQDRGYVKDVFGRRYIPKNPSITYPVGNYLVQGTSSGILKIAAVKIWQHFGTRKYFKNFIHDEIILDRLPDRSYCKDIIEIMQDFPELSIPMEVDMSWDNTNWKDKKEIKKEKINDWIKEQPIFFDKILSENLNV